jgi:hypothetical protein
MVLSFGFRVSRIELLSVSACRASVSVLLTGGTWHPGGEHTLKRFTAQRPWRGRGNSIANLIW